MMQPRSRIIGTPHPHPEAKVEGWFVLGDKGFCTVTIFQTGKEGQLPWIEPEEEGVVRCRN